MGTLTSGKWPSRNLVDFPMNNLVIFHRCRVFAMIIDDQKNDDSDRYIIFRALR